MKKFVIFPMMSEFRADLHCHSCHSDGTDTPQELIHLAIESGLSGLSITDHDTIDAYETAVDYAKDKGLKLLSGIEFSASYLGVPVHILGYNYQLNSEKIIHLCATHRLRRQQRNEAILDKLKALGYSLYYNELEQIAKGRTIGRPHIALLLLQKKIVSSLPEAFDRFLGEGKQAFHPGQPISVEQTIEVIQAAKGKALLAHPHLLKNEKTIQHLLKLPFDGIEVYYANIPYDQEKRWLECARKRKWLISGGSDYHGFIKPQNRLGSSWVDQQTFEALLQ